MKHQPSADYVSNDEVMTPRPLAAAIVRHYRPAGRILEPCCGDGAFLRSLPRAQWCEVRRGRDFFHWHRPVDWIVTNPPWSRIYAFMEHAFTLARNVVFLITINHAWTRARVELARRAGMGLREILLCDWPASWPASGFQLGALHWQQGWTGPITHTELEGSW